MVIGQGSTNTGTLSVALVGDITEIIIDHDTADGTFDMSADVTIGGSGGSGSNTISLGDIDSVSQTHLVTGALADSLDQATTSLRLRSDGKYAFLTTANLLIGTTKIVHANINAATTPIGCKICQPGKHQDHTGRQKCEDCPPGKKMPSGQHPAQSCINCLIGRYALTTGLLDCVDCAEGFYQDVSGQQECKKCGRGQYGQGTMQTDEAVACIDCQAGKFNNERNLVACKDCIKGQYSNELGLTGSGSLQCTSCVEGKYGSQAGQTTDATCLLCQNGLYNDMLGQEICAGCAIGKYGDDEGFVTPDDCKLCAIAQFNNLTGQDTCLDCLSGFYSDAVGLVDCIGCPQGYWGNTQGGSSSDEACIQCYKGKYQPITGQQSEDNCVPCPVGTYGTEWGKPSLDDCRRCEPVSVHCGYSFIIDSGSFVFSVVFLFLFLFLFLYLFLTDFSISFLYKFILYPRCQ